MYHLTIYHFLIYKSIVNISLKIKIRYIMINMLLIYKIRDNEHD